MKQAAEYRQHAGECRRLAMTAKNEAEQKQLTEMAAAWERMAVERERQIARENPEAPDQPGLAGSRRTTSRAPRC